MTHLKTLIFAVFATIASCEPPVQQGYNYNSPNNYQNGFNTPSNSYLPPNTGYNAPSTGYNAPSTGYNAPSTGYNAPSTGYKAPSTEYGAPNTGYNSPSTGYNAPSTGYNAPNGGYNAPSGQDYNGGYDSHNHDHGHGHESEVPKSYEFGYSVKDAQSGNDYGRQETSDGNTVRGEYRVQLPDGRTQIVTYHADWKTGFHADVRYEGEARYPEPQQNGYNYGASDYSASNDIHSNTNSYRPSTAYGPPGYHK
ncbi:hypothetical protein JYU34_022358 [Plutella xylostella]|uniref:Cuticular protein n=1 Tax=Plutella xylostella TaxID=51655 RepID=A0ABQ7PQS9_PLUXY|nr:hypothetical protein JYU34_022358 [Plutella xylostella]